MTAFLVKDEFKKRLKPIEHDVVQHALCIAMLVATGHASADELTDGWVTPLMLRRELAGWSAQRRRHVAAQLVWLRIWDIAKEGGYRFRDWDLEQPSAQSTVQQREKWKAYKRSERAAKRVENEPFLPNKFAAFTPPPETRIANDFAGDPPDVHETVHGGVQGDPLPLPPAAPRGSQIDSPTVSPAASAGHEVEKASPKKLKPPRKAGASSAHKQLVAELYAKAFADKHGTPASPPNWALVQAVVSWAQQTDDPEAAIRASLAGYFDSWVGSRMKHPLHLWAKSPASFHAEQREKASAGGIDETDPMYIIGPDGLSPFDRQFIVRRTA